MATAVLVHGAWQGAWCWDRFVPRLEAAGHTAATPTLTGSGARAAELTPAVDLATHIADVVAAIDSVSGDGPVVLVGHSYSGMTLPAAVAARAAAVKAVVFVDAFYPDEGQSALDQMPPPFRQLFRQRAAEEGDGWKLPASDGLLDVWGMHDQDDRRWVREQLTDWSLRCFESPSPVGRIALGEQPRWYVLGVGDHPAGLGFAAVAEHAGADGCTNVGIPGGHDLMIEAPEALAAVVLDALAL